MSTSISFGLIMLGFVGIGLASRIRAKNNANDYYLAGRTVTPMMVGLSAAASWCSGFMFIGQIGFTYSRGLSSIWIMLGLILGDLFVASLTFAKFRRQTGMKQQQSFFEGLFDSTSRSNLSPGVRVGLFFVCSVALVALVGYGAAQILASGKAFAAVYDLPVEVGTTVTAVVIAFYCFSGGIRASIWTDVAQSLVMIFAMLLLFLVSLSEIGGWALFWDNIDNMPATYTSLYPPDLLAASPLFVMLIFVGWFFGGMGVAGQPHVMIRFMALEKEQQMKRALAYYYLYYTGLYTLAILVGLCARVIIPQLPLGDAEMALPLLAQQMLPEFLVGVILAGLFSSTMSTADSQILSASAIVTRDLFSKLSENYIVVKLVTLVLVAAALALATFSSSSVFAMVIVFGGLLSSSFAPIMLVRMLGADISSRVMISMAIAGFTATTLWRKLGLSYLIYEVAIGAMAALFLYSLSALYNLKRESKSDSLNQHL